MLRWPKQCRPCLTWMQPRHTISLVPALWRHRIRPCLVSSPRSECSRLEMALSVVDLPSAVRREEYRDPAARQRQRYALCSGRCLSLSG